MKNNRQWFQHPTTPSLSKQRQKPLILEILKQSQQLQKSSFSHRRSIIIMHTWLHEREVLLGYIEVAPHSLPLKPMYHSLANQSSPALEGHVSKNVVVPLQKEFLKCKSSFQMLANPHLVRYFLSISDEPHSLMKPWNQHILMNSFLVIVKRILSSAT